MKYELYNAIKSYCEENRCWSAANTVRDWNAILSTNYTPATFTALVNTGLLVKDKRYGEKSYSYTLAKTDEVRKAEAEAKREYDIQHAHWIIEHYEESVAKKQAAYEYEIKRAKQMLEADLEFEAKRLAEAKALIGAT